MLVLFFFYEKTDSLNEKYNPKSALIPKSGLPPKASCCVCRPVGGLEELARRWEEERNKLKMKTSEQWGRMEGWWRTWLLSVRWIGGAWNRSSRWTGGQRSEAQERSLCCGCCLSAGGSVVCLTCSVCPPARLDAVLTRAGVLWFSSLHQTLLSPSLKRYPLIYISPPPSSASSSPPHSHLPFFPSFSHL